MRIQAGTGAVASWLLKTFGLDILLLAKDALQSQWRRLFASRNILILGAQQTGKSSLATFLQKGKPYHIIEGEVRPPDPTAATVIVDRKFAVQNGHWLRIKLDLPGDPDLRATWAAALREVHPAGIIYMVDGRLDEPGLQRVAGDAIDLLLSQYGSGTRELLALHMFVNHCDAWATTPAAERERLAILSGAFEARRRPHHALDTLRFAASATQLSPNRRSWPEVTRALHRFGADLLE
jgi:Signal recognition particle receptor beta subunit